MDRETLEENLYEEIEELSSDTATASETATALRDACEVGSDDWKVFDDLVNKVASAEAAFNAVLEILDKDDDEDEEDPNSEDGNPNTPSD